MAINATFIANFSSFLQAVSEADTKLQAFGATGATVTSSLNRMVDNFSGRKLIEEATKTAEAVDRIGGTSKLTEQELQQVANQAANAAAKMTALGIDVPPKVAALANEVKHVKEGLGELKEAAVSIAETLGVAFTVREIASFVGDTVEAARSLRNLSLETRIGTDELQVLSAAAKDFGVEGDQLGRAIFQLSRRIAGDDASAVSALHQMGMSLEDVKGLNGEELFLKIERGLAGVQGQLKDTTAADLFGSKLGGAMIAVSSSLDSTMTHVREMNTLMDKDAVQAAAHYADSIDHLKDSFKALALNTIGPVADALNTLIETQAKSTDKWALLKAALGDFLASAQGFPSRVLALQAAIDTPSPKDIHLPSAKEQAAAAAANAPVTSADIFAKIQLDALKALTAEQEHYLEQLFDIGQLNAKNAASFGVNAEQMDLFKKKEEEIVQAQANLSNNLREGTKLYAEIQAAGVKATDELNKKTMAWLESTTAAIQKLRDLNSTAQQALNDRSLGSGAPGSNADRAAAIRDKALAEIDAQQAAQPAGVGDNEDLFGARRAKVWADFDDAIMKGSTASNELSKAHAGAVQAAQSVTAAFTQMAAGTVPSVNLATGQGTQGTDPRVISYMSMGYTQGEALALVGGYGTSIGPPKHRAGGGPVSAGQSYFVGENGPELFTPGANGTISPNGAGGIVVNMNISGVFDPASASILASAVGSELARRTGLKMDRT